MDNLQRIKDEFERLKGQFVITDEWVIERLIAISDDDRDYYYVTYDGRRIMFNTCVGRIIALKNKIDDADYASLVRTAKLNHFDQSDRWFDNKFAKELELEIQEERIRLTTLKGNDKFITEVCWDIN